MDDTSEIIRPPGDSGRLKLSQRRMTRLFPWALLAIAVLILGLGLWLRFAYWPRMAIPSASPVIVMEKAHIMMGSYEYLSIYQDGSVLYIREVGLRVGPAGRTWNKGKIGTAELGALLRFMSESGFDRMPESHRATAITEGPPNSGNIMGDLDLSLFVMFDGIEKHVTAFGYIPLGEGAVTIDMPYPLNEVYKRLMDIAERTVEGEGGSASAATIPGPAWAIVVNALVIPWRRVSACSVRDRART